MELLKYIRHIELTKNTDDGFTIAITLFYNFDNIDTEIKRNIKTSLFPECDGKNSFIFIVKTIMPEMIILQSVKKFAVVEPQFNYLTELIKMRNHHGNFMP